MARVKVGPRGQVEFNCPGCGWTHVLNTSPAERPCWVFNGDPARPTLTPSINASMQFGGARAEKRCHSFVTDGRIRFLNDCTHALAGQEVDLPEIQEETQA